MGTSGWRDSMCERIARLAAGVDQSQSHDNAPIARIEAARSWRRHKNSNDRMLSSSAEPNGEIISVTYWANDIRPRNVSVQSG